ncbi:MAG: DNA/RNA nuclease SfsA [Peptococcaceae bacterium]|nr:DNA/RNA nuclease SfsA [Peptococcaceae bacterium]
MIYNDIRVGRFIARPNRFIAYVEADDETEICHVKNTGRCKELLLPGAKVLIDKATNPSRSTKYDLVAVYKGDLLINMDSQAPNKAFREYLDMGRHIGGVTLIRPEARYGGSRFDFYVEAGDRRIFIEVKGVTLEEDGVAMFPDAPTSRGVRHLNELAACLKEGYEAQAVFVIQMSGARYFTPNDRTHPAFGEALSAAIAAGVEVFAVECSVTERSMDISHTVPVFAHKGKPCSARFPSPDTGLGRQRI